MSLTPDQLDQAWKHLQESPLTAGWSGFREDVLPHLKPVTLGPGDVVFRPGDPPACLFVVLSGSVVQAFSEEGRPWLQQEHGPGRFFGQQALFTGDYRSTARAHPQGNGAQLLCLTAAELRFAMERNPLLHEELLREDRAGRLRRIPLLWSLEDRHIRTLAQVVEARDFDAGAPIPLVDRGAIWVVDSGQVAITGAANPHPDDRRAWRLTAGNFFLDLGQDAQVGGLGDIFGARCGAESATAYVRTRLFHLPAVHAQRMIAAFPKVGDMLRAPLAIVEELRRSELLGQLTPEQHLHLAQFCAWEFIPQPQNVTTQGHLGHSYVMLRAGAALVTALDEQGRERPRNRLLPPASYGKTSLLAEKERDATVRAAQGSLESGRLWRPGAEVIVLHRNDLQFAIRERPDLWSGDIPLVSRALAARKQQAAFDWLQEEEIVHWRGRPHILWLLGPALLVLAVFLAAVALVAATPASLTGPRIVLSSIAAGVVALLGAYVALNYYDDDYVITNRRAIRQERRPVLYAGRIEAPISMVQDVTVFADFWGRLFDFGNVTIRTAASTGSVAFGRVPHPYEVKDQVALRSMEARAAERGQQKEELRRGLLTGIEKVLPVPQRQPALGSAEPPSGRAVLARLHAHWVGRTDRLVDPPNSRSALRPLASRLPARWRAVLLGPPTPTRTPQSGAVVWRKHWLNLIRRAGLPALLAILIIVFGIPFLRSSIGVAGVAARDFTLLWLLAVVLLLAWTAWQWTDYRNDIYAVTDDRIIDIEMKPLGLSAKRREGGLERVQNVVAEQKGIWANLFNYGDVVISTAAEDEGFTFPMVPRPAHVQATIFAKLEALRARQEQRRAEQRQQDLIEGLEVYHRLQGESHLPPWQGGR